MWRFGVAAALLLLVVVLVADMIFGRTQPAEVVVRPGVPSTWQETRERLAGVEPFGASAATSPVGIRDDAGWTATVRIALAQGRMTGGGGPADVDAAPFNPKALARLPSAGAGTDSIPWPGLPPTEWMTTPSPPAAVPGAGERDGSAVGGAPLVRPALRADPAPVRPPAVKAPSEQISTMQRKLASLGYDPGPTDGRVGKKTEAAIRAFQRDYRMRVDGRIDERLLVRVDSEAQGRTQLRQQELEAMAPSAPSKPEKKEDRGLFGSVLGGFQRLLGRDFNSAQRPEEIAAYCRANADTWIYDFGREAFIYCGNIVAQHGSSRG